MAAGIVDLLQVVYVDDRIGQVRGVPFRRGTLQLQQLGERSPIEQAGQTVGARELVEGRIPRGVLSEELVAFGFDDQQARAKVLQFGTKLGNGPGWGLRARVAVRSHRHLLPVGSGRRRGPPPGGLRPLPTGAASPSRAIPGGCPQASSFIFTSTRNI